MAPRFAIVMFVSLLTLAATVSNLAAQGRGRGHHVGTFGSAAPAPPSAPRSTFVGRALVRFGTPFPSVTIVRPQRRIIVPAPFIGVYPGYVWGAPVYPAPAYGTPAYIAPAYAAPNYVTPSVNQYESELSYQLQQLRQQLEQLRQERSVMALQQLQPTSQPSQAPERPAKPTILIFRDGHRESIQNYAIVGQTFWILDEKSSVKISLSELDLETTQRENRSQGVRFPLPER